MSSVHTDPTKDLQKNLPIVSYCLIFALRNAAHGFGMFESLRDFARQRSGLTSKERERVVLACRDLLQLDWVRLLGRTGHARHPDIAGFASLS